jgi:hypothetical protein
MAFGRRERLGPVRIVFVFVFALGQRQGAAVGHPSAILEPNETICGAVPSRPQPPVLSLCRSSFSIPLFPNRPAFPVRLKVVSLF